MAAEEESNAIERYRGDTYSIEAELTKNGVPINLSTGNYTAKFSFASGSKYTSIPGANGNASGQVSFPFPATASQGVYTYDIQVTSASGEIQTYVQDTLTIIDDISR